MTSGDGQSAITTMGGGPGVADPEHTFSYAAPGSYTATFTGTDALGRTLNTATTKVIIGDAYHSIGSPKVVLNQRVPAHGVVRVAPAALGGSYAAGTRAAFSDVTVSGAGKPGSITFYPDGAAGRAITALTFTAGSTVAGVALLTPGSDGKVDLVNNSGGPVTLSVRPYGLDVTKLAWKNLDGYLPITPVQVVSGKTVRGCGTIGGCSTVTINVEGGHGLPSIGSDAVAVTLTVSHGRSVGYLSYVDNGVHYVNWAAGQQVSRLVVLHTTGAWAPFNVVSSGSVVVSASVVGYYNMPTYGSAPGGVHARRPAACRAGAHRRAARCDAPDRRPIRPPVPRR
jgi:hypothetical protein